MSDHERYRPDSRSRLAAHEGEAQRAVCRRGRIAAHSGRACANGTRDAPSRLIKLKKLEAEEAAGLISSSFFVGLLQLG
jgi:hypothetical protein